MFYFFTDSYEEEILYSSLARYHYYSGNISVLDTFKDAFGRETSCAIEIPNGIEDFSNNFFSKKNYDVDIIINNNTLLPIYYPFLTKLQQREITQLIKGKDFNHKIGANLGISTGKVKGRGSLLYCPICAQEDIERFEEPYFHRVHQVPKVLICPEHLCILETYLPSYTPYSFIRLQKEKLLKVPRYIKGEDSKLLFHLAGISKSFFYLLKSPVLESREIVANRYQLFLYERNLAFKSGMIKKKELGKELINFYGKEFLMLMDSEISVENDFYWLRYIKNQERFLHPIRHILLILYLSQEINAFFRDIQFKKEVHQVRLLEIENNKPFGTGPWPCLNPTAEHYLEAVINKCDIKISKKTNKPVGTFLCSCGYVYIRRGPDKTENDKYKRTTVKYYGEIWEEKLRELVLVHKITKVNQLTKKLDCTFITIVRYLKKLGLYKFVDSNSTFEHKSLGKTVNHLDNYKSQILSFISENPETNRRLIQINLPAQYKYVYDHDKIWFNKNLPQVCGNGNFKSNRLDWQRRDKALFEDVKNAIEVLSNCPEVNITFRKISIKTKEISNNKYDLRNINLNKLPRTKKLIDETLESIESFRLRKITQASIDLIEAGEKLSKKKILINAGVHYKDCTNKISQKIEEILEKVN